LIYFVFVILTNSNFSFRCDCKFDCTNGEDEEECQACSDALFRCPDELRSINLTSVCNGVSDCTHGADELPHVCSNLATTTERRYSQCTALEEFECSSGQCIPSNFKCDGFRHCNDGTDEGLICGTSFQMLLALFH
jgi:low density lipoprotein-related protein 2